MIAVAIVGVMTALAVPGFTAYQLKEQTRGNTQQVATALREAHNFSIRRGRQYFALFNPPPPAPPGTLVRIVQDVDADWQVSVADTTTDFGPLPATDAAVTIYSPAGGGGPFPGSSLVPGDPSPGNLGTVVDGANFPIDPSTGSPAVGFTTQGIPVDLNSPTAWGTGSGAFYMTDNRGAVYAVVVMPLGEIRVRTLDGATDQWR